MRRLRLIAVVLVALAALGQPAAVDDYELGDLLSRLDRVASLYRDNALKFSCREKIVYRPSLLNKKAHQNARQGAGGLILKLEYIYEYNDEGHLSDYRTRRGSKKKVHDEVDPADLGVPLSLKRAYSWVFIFERAKWRMYDYTIEGHEQALGRDAIRMAFSPIEPITHDLNDWYGTAWIDEKTSQLLRVSAMKANQWDEKERLEQDFSSGDDSAEVYEFASIQTEFTVEENGMRFPGEVEINNSRYRIRRVGARRTTEEEPVYRVSQSYRNYRFFGVKTYDQIRQIVAGSPGVIVDE